MLEEIQELVDHLKGVEECMGFGAFKMHYLTYLRRVIQRKKLDWEAEQELIAAYRPEHGDF